MAKMLILPGIASAGNMHDDYGLLDRPSALEYARRRGYEGKLLDISGETGKFSRQVDAAIAALVMDHSIEALYGFSGGGYNVVHVMSRLVTTRRRIKLVVILGAPGAGLLDGDFEVVRRPDPPEGHMAGPKMLLAELGPDPDKKFVRYAYPETKPTPARPWWKFWSKS